MKKLLLILLCLPMIFSCGEKKEEIRIEAGEKGVEFKRFEGGLDKKELEADTNFSAPWHKMRVYDSIKEE